MTCCGRPEADPRVRVVGTQTWPPPRLFVAVCPRCGSELEYPEAALEELTAHAGARPAPGVICPACGSIVWQATATPYHGAKITLHLTSEKGIQALLDMLLRIVQQAGQERTEVVITVEGATLRA